MPVMSVISSPTSRATADIKIGDTITDQRHPAREPLPGFQEIHPMVFSGIYPINTGDFEHLKTAIGKLRLNDSAFVYQPESSVALGFRISLRVSRVASHGDHPGDGSGASTTWTSSRPTRASFTRS